MVQVFADINAEYQASLLHSAAKCIYWIEASEKKWRPFWWRHLENRTQHSHTHTHTHTQVHTHYTPSLSAKVAKSRRSFPHMHPQCMWQPPLNGNGLCYHYLCILFVHMSLCPVVLSFWQKAYQHLVWLLVWFSNYCISDVNLYKKKQQQIIMVIFLSSI